MAGEMGIDKGFGEKLDQSRLIIAQAGRILQ